MTSHVSAEDFQLGYSMTGLVERSSSKYVNFQTTHLAFVRRSQEQHGEHNHPFLSGNDQQEANKRFNKSFISTNLEFSKMLITNTHHHHHSLDNQYQSARNLLKRNLQNQRCDSTSSDSSTSTLVEDGFRNDEVHHTASNNTRNEMFNKNNQDLILVLPKVSISNSVKSENENDTSSCNVSSRKKCCSVQCIDSMSTVSSECPPCTNTTLVSNCFKKSPLPVKKEINSLPNTRCKPHENEEPTTALNGKLSSSAMQGTSRIAKPNFPHFIKTPKNSFSPYKKISSKETLSKYTKTDSNEVQISGNPERVHQFHRRSPFKEWLL